MKLVNKTTGDVLSVPPPDELGQSYVLLNAKVIEHVLYSDDGSITLGSGMQFPTGTAFATYLVERLSMLIARPPGAGTDDK